MIPVRESYQVRFGRMDQAIDYWSRLPKEVTEWPDDRAEYEILTDLSGEMFTLVVARHVISVEAWRGASRTDRMTSSRSPGRPDGSPRDARIAERIP